MDKQKNLKVQLRLLLNLSNSLQLLCQSSFHLKTVALLQSLVQAMHALFEDIHVDFKFSAKEQSGSFAIYSMQIDNQLLTSSRPVVLSHDPPAQVALPRLLVCLETHWLESKHECNYRRSSKLRK